jgi:hypothetical protein
VTAPEVPSTESDSEVDAELDRALGQLLDEDE